MVEAGYSPKFARGNQKTVMESEGVKAIVADSGFTMTQDELIGEYQFIAKQRKDLTNKRVVVENILAHKNPKLDLRPKKTEGGGNTYNTLNLINLSPEDRRKRMVELSNTLLAQPIAVEQGNQPPKE